MRGTITDFLAFVSARPELSRELIDLAARHGFEFSVDELSDSELQDVVGGVFPSLQNVDLQNALVTQQQVVQSLSNVSKIQSDTTISVIRKIG